MTFLSRKMMVWFEETMVLIHETMVWSELRTFLSKDLFFLFFHLSFLFRPMPMRLKKSVFVSREPSVSIGRLLFRIEHPSGDRRKSASFFLQSSFRHRHPLDLPTNPRDFISPTDFVRAPMLFFSRKMMFRSKQRSSGEDHPSPGSRRLRARSTRRPGASRNGRPRRSPSLYRNEEIEISGVDFFGAPVDFFAARTGTSGRVRPPRGRPS